MTRTPRLQTAADVMESLTPPKRKVAPSNGPDAARRAKVFGTDMAQMDQPQPMSRLINWALHDLMLEHDDTLLMGEDVGRKGGNYGVTQKLHARFGPARVIDTLLDEHSILGLAIGVAHDGFVPMPEIQFLAYLHNAEDPLRGEAATLPFFSRGRWANPMVVLRDIPGLILTAVQAGL